jgi:hypothetical protein
MNMDPVMCVAIEYVLDGERRGVLPTAQLQRALIAPLYALTIASAGDGQMALRKKKRTVVREPSDPWQDYVDLLGKTTGEGNALVLVPLFPAGGFVPGNLLMIPARAARALAGIGTPEEVLRARNCILRDRAKSCH